MNNRQHEIFGIHRTALLVIVVATMFGSFSVYKALGGGPFGSERSASAQTHETLERVTGTESVAPAGISCDSSVSWLPASASSSVKTTLTAIEQIQVGDRVLAESPTGEEDTAFGSEIIPSDWRKLTLRAPKRDGTVVASMSSPFAGMAIFVHGRWKLRLQNRSWRLGLDQVSPLASSVRIDSPWCGRETPRESL